MDKTKPISSAAPKPPIGLGGLSGAIKGNNTQAAQLAQEAVLDKKAQQSLGGGGWGGGGLSAALGNTQAAQQAQDIALNADSKTDDKVTLTKGAGESEGDGMTNRVKTSLSALQQAFSK